MKLPAEPIRPSPEPSPWPRALHAVLWIAACAACAPEAPTDRVRVSGQVEATEVHVAALVGGRILELSVAEGDRVEMAAPIARLDTADAELARVRAQAERDRAVAQLRLLQAGARPEEVRQAEAQVASAQADAAATEAELAAAEIDVERFEALLASNSGSSKQRDDAVARRNVARERLQGARDRMRAASEYVARLQAGARPEEIEAARAQVAAAAAQIATWDKAIADAAVEAPIGGIVTGTLAEVGELAQPSMPLVVITDLDRAWANVCVQETVVPLLRVGESATIFPDGVEQGLAGTISYVSPRAEFTPRNVQTAEDSRCRFGEACRCCS